MPEKSFIDESRSAARGIFALLVGDRAAPSYFSFTQQGLIGSFIALLLVTALELITAAAMGGGGIAAAAFQTALVYGFFIAASALYLRQLGRSDALRPYLVTLNWSNAVFSLILLVLSVLGAGIIGFIAVIAGLIMAINIGRLIMALKPLHIFLLFVVQVVGVSLAVLIILLVFPPTPEQLAAIAAAGA